MEIDGRNEHTAARPESAQCAAGIGGRNGGGSSRRCLLLARLSRQCAGWGRRGRNRRRVLLRHRDGGGTVPSGAAGIGDSYRRGSSRRCRSLRAVGRGRRLRDRRGCGNVCGGRGGARQRCRAGSYGSDGPATGGGAG